MPHGDNDETKLCQTGILVVVDGESGRYIFEMRTWINIADKSGMVFVLSKSAGFHITPYRSVYPSAAFTLNLSGAFQPKA